MFSSLHITKRSARPLWDAARTFTSFSKRSAAATSSTTPASAPASVPAKTLSQEKTKLKSQARPNRIYPKVKRERFNAYVKLFSSSKAILFFNFHGLSVKELTAIRTEVKNQEKIDSNWRLTVLRAGLLPPVFRTLPHLSSPDVTSQLKGSMFIISSQSETVDPKGLAAMLRIYDKHAKKLNQAVPSSGNKQASAATPATPKLVLLNASLEERVFGPEALRDVSKLAPLSVMHGQIVGLLEQSMSSIVSVLSRASGQDLVRTLDSYEKDLQAKQDAN